jgi:hypothetical protein
MKRWLVLALIQWSLIPFLFGCDKPQFQLDGANIPQQWSGRFTLHRSENMWNFLLLDTWTGKLWKCQFSLNETLTKEQKEKGLSYDFCRGVDLYDKR